MINSLEKVDIKNETCPSSPTEHEIQVLRDFFIIHNCIYIIKKSVSILLDKEDKNDER